MNTTEQSRDLDRPKARKSPAGRWLIATVIGLLVGIAAFAQPGERMKRHHSGPGENLDRLEKLLDLTSDQKSSIESIYEAHRTAGEDQRAAHRANAEALRAALEAADPDPTAVGELVLHLLLGL